MAETLESVLLELDSFNGCISEQRISSRIDAATKDNDTFNALAELMAFSFTENYENQVSGWGTYYGPMMVWSGEDGKTYERPNVSLVDKNILDYWNARSTNSDNYIMKARYSGLIWDLTETVTGNKPSHQSAIDCINALIEICNK